MKNQLLLLTVLLFSISLEAQQPSISGKFVQQILKTDFKKAYKGVNWKNPECLKLRENITNVGNQAYGQNYKPTLEEQKEINKIVDKYLELGKNRKTDDFEEGFKQIIQLWHLALPQLLKSIEDKDAHKAQIAGSLLLRMKNEKIVKLMMDRAKNTSNLEIKKRYEVVLRLTKNSYKIAAQNRQGISKQESEAIYAKIVEPNLKEVQEEIKALQQKQ